MGPAVNLAARLMCMCEKLNVELLCNDELHDKFLGGDSDSFDFEPFDPMKVKGYTNPVTFYHPILKDTDGNAQTGRKSSTGGNVSNFIRRHTQSARPSHASGGGLTNIENGGRNFTSVDVGMGGGLLSKSTTPSRDDRTKSPPRMVKHLLGFKPSTSSTRKSSIPTSHRNSDGISSPQNRSQAATLLVNSQSGGDNGLKSNRGSKSSSRANTPQPRRSEGLRQHVLSHLDALSLGHQMILKTASAIGVVFDRSVLINTYPGSAAEADEALSTTLSTFVMRLEGDTQHDVRFAFRSAATASVIYDLMLQAQKKRLHKQIAAWYERVRVLRRREGLRTEEDLVAPLALHYLLSGDEDRAKKLFVAAGRLSCSQGRYLEAVSHFDACLNLFTTRNGDDDDDIFCEVLVWLAQTIVRYGIPYKAPSFIDPDHHEEKEENQEVVGTSTPNNESSQMSSIKKKNSNTSSLNNTNSVKCAEKLLQRAFAVLNGRIMRKVVARFLSAQLSSAMERWRLHVNQQLHSPPDHGLSPRDLRESFNGNGLGYRRGSGNPRGGVNNQNNNNQQAASTSLGRSNSLVSSQPSNVSAFLTPHSVDVNTLTAVGQDSGGGIHKVENREVSIRRRLQIAKVKAQLGWVLSADPIRCMKEGEQIKVINMLMSPTFLLFIIIFYYMHHLF